MATPDPSDQIVYINDPNGTPQRRTATIQEVVESVSGEGQEGGGGAGVLEDPGNVWEPDTAVTEGYRIAETVDGELRVFEVTVSGTTGAAEAFTEYSVNLTPLGETTTGPVTWRYLGKVGELPWDVVPVRQGLPETWTVGEDPELLIESPADVTDYVYLLSLKARDGVSEAAVLDITSAGDSDLFLYDSGTSIRVNDVPNLNIVLSAGLDSVFVMSQANQVLWEVDRSTGAIRMPNLPTANPNVAGELWNDGGTLKVSAG